MPTRMIREGILDSERYWSCTIEARELYRHLQLLADDFGCVSLSPAFVGRRCFDTRPTGEKLTKLIAQLVDADLIRYYESCGAAYGFIPRFRQRLQRFTLKHPKPPESLLHDDFHAIELFKRINGKNQSPAVGQQLPNGSPTHEVEVEEKLKRREVEVEAPKGKALYQWAQENSIHAGPRETATDFKARIESEFLRRPNQRQTRRNRVVAFTPQLL